MNNSALQFQSLLAQSINQLVSILGPDITYATLNQIPEISLDEMGKIKAIEGVDEDIVAKIITVFSSLAPEVTKGYITPLFSSYLVKSDGVPGTLGLPQHHLSAASALTSFDTQQITHGSDTTLYTEVC